MKISKLDVIRKKHIDYHMTKRFKKRSSLDRRSNCSRRNAPLFGNSYCDLSTHSRIPADRRRSGEKRNQWRRTTTWSSSPVIRLKPDMDNFIL